MQFSAFPFLRWAIVLILGILFQDLVGLDSDGLWMALGLSVGGYLLLWALLTGKPFRLYHSLLGLWAVGLVMIAGMLLRWQADERHLSGHVSSFSLDSLSAYRGVVVDPISHRNRWDRTTLRITAISVSGEWRRASGSVMAYFEADSVLELAYGDVVLISGKPFEPSPPANPAQFDYQHYLARQQIYHQHFIKSGTYEVIGHGEYGSHFFALTLEIRRWADEVLRRYIPSPKSYAIVAALSLGIKDGLDTELRDAYAAAGAMHVLAVSGLHVGILVLILGWVFKPVAKKPAGRWLKVLTSLAFLWVYAFVTGLSPSVMRAVTMFTFVLLGQLFDRKISIYNSLGISAFLLLCWQPMMVFKVGFQLSYCAVIGIVYFQPKFARLWYPPNRVAQWAWELFCVSLAAQLATFPIGVYYFHQFPVFFWLSNFMVIPAAMAILAGALGLFVVASLPWLAKLLGWGISGLVYLVNQGIFWIEALPYSVMEGLHLGFWQVVMLYGIMILLATMVARREVVWLGVAIVCGGVIAIKETVLFADHISQKQIVVYQAKKATALALVSGSHARLLLDSAVYADENQLAFSIYPHLESIGVERMERLILEGDSSSHIRSVAGQFSIVWEGRRVLIIREKYKQVSGQADIVILSRQAVWSLDELSHLQFDQLVIDSSYGFYRSQKLKEEAEKMGVDVHAVSLDGAYVAAW